MLIDTHAHLYWDSYSQDLDQVLQRAVDAGVTHVINIGVDIETSQKAAELNSDKIAFFSSIGLHPHEAIKYSSDVSIHSDVERLDEIYQSNRSKVVAVGECGLDYLGVDEQTKDLQRKLFQAQINLAKKLNLPLLVHCRDDRFQNSNNTECWDEVIKMTKDHFGIYHCYSGLPQTTARILKNTKFLISFAGNLTYPNNEYLRQAVKEMPLDRIVVETDCPFLPPQSKRGQRNEPSFIVETVKIIAEIKGIPEPEVKEQTSKNLRKIGKLEL